MRKKAILTLTPGGDRLETHHGFQAAQGEWPKPQTHHGYPEPADPGVSPETHHGFLLTFAEAPNRILVQRDEKGNLVLTFGE